MIRSAVEQNDEELLEIAKKINEREKMNHSDAKEPRTGYTDRDINRSSHGQDDEVLEDLKKREGKLLQYKDWLITYAKPAYVSYNCGAIREELEYRYNENGEEKIRIWFVSVPQYKLGLEKQSYENRPFLDEESSGVPALRRYLLNLTGDNQLSALQRHVRHNILDLYKTEEYICRQSIEAEDTIHEQGRTAHKEFERENAIIRDEVKERLRSASWNHATPQASAPLSGPVSDEQSMKAHLPSSNLVSGTSSDTQGYSEDHE